MAGNEVYILTYEFISQGNGQLGIAGVVTIYHQHGLTESTTFDIKFCHRQFSSG
jgi:hypothetical protein